MTELTETQRLVRRILRVNHAGEHGAIAIYGTQIGRARTRYPDLGAWLDETLSHEQRHRAAFLEAMPARGAKPCRALIVWSVGGRMLGWITALFGRAGVLICTAAVERTVHRHLNEQIAYLAERDPSLAALIRDIQVDEDAHLAFAEAQQSQRGFAARLLAGIVAGATETLIWVSTRGDSMRLRSAMRRATA